MKKRIRKTGEIVDVINYSAPNVERDKGDYVSYIDSKGVEHHTKRGMNIHWDFEDVEEELSKEIDWEQRRYEIAKDMMAAFLSNSCSNVHGGTVEKQAYEAVLYADAVQHLTDNSVELAKLIGGLKGIAMLDGIVNRKIDKLR